MSTSPKPSASPKTPAQYSREEMDAILQRALHRQATKEDGVSHDELVAAAAEIGVPREELEAAARDLALEKAKQAPLEEARQRRKERLSRGYAMFAVLSLAMFVLGHSTGQHQFFIPVAVVGMILTIRTLRFVFGAPERVRETKQERRARRREEKLHEFERKITIGTDAVVRVVEAARGPKKGGKPRTRKEKEDFAAKLAKAETEKALASAYEGSLRESFDGYRKNGGKLSAKSDAVPASRARVDAANARIADVERELDDEELEDAREKKRRHL